MSMFFLILSKASAERQVDAAHSVWNRLGFALFGEYNDRLERLNTQSRIVGEGCPPLCGPLVTEAA